MEQVLKQFTIAFGLNNTALKSGLKDSENALSSFADTAKRLLGAWVSYEFFKNAISNFSEYTTQLSNASVITGASVNSINALGGALKRFGGNAESAINAIKSINQHLHEAKFGGGALLEISKKYGVVISKGATAEQTLLNLAKQMGRYDRQTRIAIASQLGLDEAMVRAFADGGKELEQLINKQKKLNIIDPRDEKIAQKFTYALLDLKDIFTALMRDFARVILPSFTKLLNIFTSFIEFLRKHKIFVTAFFAGILVALTPILLTLGKMAIASSLAFAPFYAIGAIIASLALVFEDLLYYFQGYESVTGNLVKKFPLLGALIEPLRSIVLGIYDTFKSIYTLITEPSWDNLSKVFKNVGNVIKSLIEIPIKAIKNIIDGLIDKFPILETALKPFQIMVNAIYEAFKAISDIVANFSLDKMLNGISSVKESVSGFFDKINPLNLFSSDEKKQNKDKEGEQNEQNNSLIKDSVGGFLDKINPLNLFSSDEKEPKQEKEKKYLINEREVIKDDYIANAERFKQPLKSYNEKSRDKEQEPKKYNIEHIAPLKIEAPKMEPLKIEPIKIEALKLEAQAPVGAPLPPMSQSVINNSNSTASTTNNTYNTTNNINQNITSATPKQLADGTNKILIDSINHQRQQQGAF